MKNNPFFSKEVSARGIIKGFVISFSCLVMLLMIFSLSIDGMSRSLKGEYSSYPSDSRVLGVEDDIPDFVGDYGEVDEYIWEWSWNREGYVLNEKFLNSPTYYLPKGILKLEDSWILKNGYTLSLSCEQLNSDDIVLGEYNPCTLSYNGEALDYDVLYSVYCLEENEFCNAQVSFLVYSSLLMQEEYVIVSNYAGGSHDWISVFRLNDGQATRIPFIDKEGRKDWIMVSNGMNLNMYAGFKDISNNRVQLVTYYYEPSMATEDNVGGVYDIWDIVSDQLIHNSRLLQFGM